MPTPRRVPAWHLHRRLYDWVLSLAHHKHATTSLFALSFAESSFFPVPPDVLQIALTLERRDRAWWFAFVSTVGSVLGGLAGYAIGALLWQAVGGFFFEHVPGFTHAHFDYVQQQYAAHAFLAIVTAAFTPIPYKVFTITAGVFGVPLWALVLGSLLGRAGRFFLVGAFIWKFGEPAKRFVDRYFNWLTLAFMAMLVGGVYLVQRSAGHGPPPGEAPAEQPTE
ncbi:MAG: DedA family protein [Phycisphaerales bacterium]|nr:DedA family protein [Phycisphaerales bacterium]